MPLKNIYILTIFCILTWLPHSTVFGATAEMGLRSTSASKIAVILAPSGSADIESRESLERLMAVFKKSQKDMHFSMAFTSQVARQELYDSSGEVPSVSRALADLSDAGFSHVAILSLHAIQDEEYEAMQKEAAAMQAVISNLKEVQVSRPLMGNEDDVNKLASHLIHSVPEGVQKGEAVLFAGTGSNTTGSLAYPALNWSLMRQGERGSLYLAVNVDSTESIESAIGILKINTLKGVWVIPLATTIDESLRNKLFGTNQESLSTRLKQAGLRPAHYEKGLTENTAVQNLWQNRLKAITQKLMNMQ